MTTARLIFEDGKEFYGSVFADGRETFGEVVFNTAMSGYQEVLTDPSYSGQFVLMTYPLIGNYGITTEDMESNQIYLNGLIVREYIDFPSNWRSTMSLKNFLEAHHVLGVENIDTRAVTRYIREKGAMRATLTTSTEDVSIIVDKIKASPTMAGQNLAATVSTKAPYIWEDQTEATFKVAVLDCGVKYNILRQLQVVGCACTVFPYDTPSETILNGGFDGVFLSNGPGDPEPLLQTVETVKALLGKLPIFGICLGNQILGLALGGKTYKLKFGHHGVNHPVKHLKTGHVEITSQNHGFVVDIDSLGPEIEVTHINLNDNTLEGFRHKKLPAFAVQYHPESAPGPHDSRYLFDDFIAMIKENKRVAR